MEALRAKLHEDRFLTDDLNGMGGEIKAKRAVGGLFKCRVLIRNTIGKAVMNAGVYAGLKVTPTTKKLPDGSTKQNGVILNLFNAEEDNEKTTTLIRMPNAEQLHKLLEENAKAMS